MKKTTWRKHHKWFGIIFCFFLIMFCLSGIILNHRTLVSGISIGREWLPGRYRYTSWNGGLLRGTTPCRDEDSTTCVLVYGTGGIWKTDNQASLFSDFNAGLPGGADYRQIKNIVQTADNSLYAVSIFGLYRHASDAEGWQSVFLPKDNGELLTDAVCINDTLIVVGRSYIYMSVAPYTDFKKIQLKQPEGYGGEVSLFRTVWMLHSGELFGMPGKIIVDAIAVILLLLCVTGLMFWLLPKYARRKRMKGNNAGKAVQMARMSLLWHDKIGRSTILLTVFITLTGWCLRPPVMIPLALTKVPAVPGTALDNSNSWNDKLRILRYDDECQDWLLSTSEGFFSLKTLDQTPARIDQAPPVSVMGLNVLEHDACGKWLCGSFSGMYIWDRQQQTITDYFNNEPTTSMPRSAFGKQSISGYSKDLGDNAIVADYGKGTDAILQPTEFDTLPMSLWNLALEIHSGRIYMGSAATYVFVFFVGIGAIWCLWSGWKLRKPK
ncbi:MAG: PepSY domain-containing protein [Bacteroides sp.]|nr:PepSY domain-containing protein [Bacteroides sp.]MCM1448391.1 PepSY domain-containing protein [Bacteroides sp.]